MQSNPFQWRGPKPQNFGVNNFNVWGGYNFRGKRLSLDWGVLASQNLRPRSSRMPSRAEVPGDVLTHSMTDRLTVEGMMAAEAASEHFCERLQKSAVLR